MNVVFVTLLCIILAIAVGSVAFVISAVGHMDIPSTKLEGMLLALGGLVACGLFWGLWYSPL